MTLDQSPSHSRHDGEADNRNERIKIYMNGKIVLTDQAMVSVYGLGGMPGAGMWVGMRLHDGEWTFSRAVQGSGGTDPDRARTMTSGENGRDKRARRASTAPPGTTRAAAPDPTAGKSRQPPGRPTDGCWIETPQDSRQRSAGSFPATKPAPQEAWRRPAWSSFWSRRKRLAFCASTLASSRRRWVVAEVSSNMAAFCWVT